MEVRILQLWKFTECSNYRQESVQAHSTFPGMSTIIKNTVKLCSCHDEPHNRSVFNLLLTVTVQSTLV